MSEQDPGRSNNMSGNDLDNSNNMSEKYLDNSNNMSEKYLDNSNNMSEKDSDNSNDTSEEDSDNSNDTSEEDSDNRNDTSEPDSDSSQAMSGEVPNNSQAISGEAPDNNQEREQARSMSKRALERNPYEEPEEAGRYKIYKQRHSSDEEDRDAEEYGLPPGMPTQHGLYNKQEEQQTTSMRPGFSDYLTNSPSQMTNSIISLGSTIGREAGEKIRLQYQDSNDRPVAESIRQELADHYITAFGEAFLTSFMESSQADVTNGGDEVINDEAQVAVDNLVKILEKSKEGSDNE